MNNEKPTDTSRRNLLKGAITAAVAGTAVAATSKAALAQEEQKPQTDKKVTGYRETQHIRDYYDTL